MTTQTIIVLVAIIAIIVLALSWRRGPRVTQIDRIIRKEKDSRDA